MAQGVDQAKPHAAPAIGLHAGDVGDSCNVVVIEPVMEPKDGRGQECKLKAVRRCGHECMWARPRAFYCSIDSHSTHRQESEIRAQAGRGVFALQAQKATPAKEGTRRKERFLFVKLGVLCG